MFIANRALKNEASCLPACIKAHHTLPSTSIAHGVTIREGLGMDIRYPVVR